VITRPLLCAGGSGASMLDLTPFWLDLTPFWKFVTPFWKFVTPFWKFVDRLKDVSGE
jgi:hypothetical protein